MYPPFTFNDRWFGTTEFWCNLKIHINKEILNMEVKLVSNGMFLIMQYFKPIHLKGGLHLLELMNADIQEKYSCPVSTSASMRYNKLSDPELIMTWGVQNSEADAHEQLSYAENGINILDTAEMYPVPLSKETEGRTDRYVGQKPIAQQGKL
ncbi:hypothetical protein SELMODRAFT_412916 [Selaginella moellendorffii]|uniref:NADP-dependent oxidoreductase domain-containing protein n=1 Tax=Selaginella moellendorffii TaxID=88036 RepID=D8RMR3_SELML|nr:hypothetical protein SELMODRAFT_412916 [Selaginella moellendorffii]